MNKKIILLMAFILIILIGCQKQSYDFFAKCLSEKGAVMYGAYWCGHCKEQKKMLGSSFQYISYIECTEKQQTCDDDGITAYPTWVINENKYEGVQPLSKLASLTNCEINSIKQ